MSGTLLALVGAHPLTDSSSVVLEGCAFTTMLAVLYPLALQRSSSARFGTLALACLAHLIASALALIQGLIASGRGMEEHMLSSDLVASTILDVVSAAFLIASLVRKPEDSTRIPALGTALAVLPSAMVAMSLVWHGSTAALRFAYTLTLAMFSSVHATIRERDLAAWEAQVSQRQARVLAEQMRPHFIFNALSTIQGLCYEEPEVAAAQVEHFSDYLRGHMDALAAGTLVPFTTEVGHAREYAALSRAGSSTPFELVWDLRETDFEVPPLTVQPIVENAIRYGALARTDGQGSVRVNSERRGAYAHVVVEDNGPGIDEKSIRGGNRRGIGLANARERLRTQCDGMLSVSSSERGTRVVIIVPIGNSDKRGGTARERGTSS